MSSHKRQWEHVRHTSISTSLIFQKFELCLNDKFFTFRFDSTFTSWTFSYLKWKSCTSSHLFAFKTNKCHHFICLYDMNFNIAVATTIYNLHSGCSVTFMLKSWFLTLMEILLPFIAISIVYCYSFPVIMQLLLMTGWILRCALTNQWCLCVKRDEINFIDTIYSGQGKFIIFCSEFWSDAFKDLSDLEWCFLNKLTVESNALYELLLKSIIYRLTVLLQSFNNFKRRFEVFMSRSNALSSTRMKNSKWLL